MTSYIREYGPLLVDNGYPVVELSAGKKCPTRKQWQTTPLSAQACRQHPEEEGVGILCGYGDNPICAVDVDFNGTQDEADALYQALVAAYPESTLAIYRVGKAPRFALLFRAEGSWTKQTTRYYTKDGDEQTKSRIEVLGRGQQIVLYHEHPDTHQPYTYPKDFFSGEPKDVPVELLPILTYKGMQDLCDAFDRFMDENAWEADIRTDASLAVDADDFASEELVPKRRVGLTIDMVRKLMKKRVESWSDYTTWFEDGMRIHHETEGSPEGLALWDELSQLAPKYSGFSEVEQKWNSFHNRGQRSLSMWPIARESNMVIGRAAEFTEDGLLCRVLRDWGDHLRYAPKSKRWYYFESEKGRWDELGPEASICTRFRDEILNTLLTKEIADAMAEGNEARAQAAKKFQRKCLDSESSAQDKLLKNLTRTREVFVDENEMDKKPGFIAVENGLVNLKTRDLVPNTPDALMVKYCDVSYDPSADCPVWRECMSVWFESEEVARYMQKVLGKMLGGRPDEEAFYLLIGDGANGKSRFLDAIADVLGGYAKALGDETVVGRKSTTSGGQRADLVRLQGARFAYCSETGSGASFRAADLKRLSGGDTVAVRGMYAAELNEFKPMFTLFVATNFAPNMQGADGGLRRRLRLIQFPHDFEHDPVYAKRRIKDLAYRLKAERAGIFNWLLEGYELAEREGVEPPLSIVTATNEYADEHDLVARWFEEDCEVCEGAVVSVKDLFLRFRKWAEDQNVRNEIMHQKGLTDRLKKLISRQGVPIAIKKTNGFSRAFGLKFRDPTSIDGAPIADDDDFDSIP